MAASTAAVLASLNNSQTSPDASQSSPPSSTLRTKDRKRVESSPSQPAYAYTPHRNSLVSPYPQERLASSPAPHIATLPSSSFPVPSHRSSPDRSAVSTPPVLTAQAQSHQQQAPPHNQHQNQHEQHPHARAPSPHPHHIVPPSIVSSAASASAADGPGGADGRTSAIIHTDDAATKLSDRVRRRCFNCCITDTSVWRRSILSPGKVLCNKCGLFERTHGRPRPDQFPHMRGAYVVRE